MKNTQFTKIVDWVFLFSKYPWKPADGYTIDKQTKQNRYHHYANRCKELDWCRTETQPVAGQIYRALEKHNGHLMHNQERNRVRSDIGQYFIRLQTSEQCQITDGGTGCCRNKG